jgi:hypothetical protein
MTTPIANIQEWAASNNLTMTSIFVPFSASRSRLERHKSLNFIVTLSSNTGSISTDYMKGNGHLEMTISPTYRDHVSIKNLDLLRAKNECCETGKYHNGFSGNIEIKRVSGKAVKFPTPTIDEVLYSLNNDSDVANYSFEEWAENYGYDSDSISANNIYLACQKTAKEFRKMLSSRQRAELTELLQEY